MDRANPLGDDVGPARILVEELLHTGLAFSDLLACLLEDLPDGTFPGEETGSVLIEMVIGSCLPAVEAAGEPACRAATALVGAVKDRVFDDLRAAAERAEA
jgi:hypothetical protein